MQHSNHANPVPGQSRAHLAIWDPSDQPSTRFLIGGGGSSDTVRLYEAEQGRSRPRYRPLAVKTDLPPVKCLAWSTADRANDLIAVGTHNGRTLLFYLPQDTTAPPQNGVGQVGFGARLNRSCSAVAFDPSGRLLAVGLEKARDFGLHIYDVEKSSATLAKQSSTTANLSAPPFKSSSLKRDPPSPINRSFLMRSIIEAPSRSSSLDHVSPYSLPFAPVQPQTASAAESSALIQTASSEAVTALTFLLPTPDSHCPVLLVGASGKSVRQYDLRSPGSSGTPALGISPVSQWPTRSVIGMEADPFNGYRFASWGDDGAVRIWDTRRANESLLMFSDEQAGTNSRATGPGASALRNGKVAVIGGYSYSSVVHSLVWSRTRRGLLAVLDGDASRIRLWDIIDGTTSVQDYPGNGASSRRTSSEAQSHASGNSSSCMLYSDTLMHPFSRQTQIIVSANLPPSFSGACELPQSFLGVARDGHLEILNYRAPGSAAWGARGDAAFSGGAGLCLKEAPNPSVLALRIGDGLLRSPGLLSGPFAGGRGRSSSNSQVVYPRTSSTDLAGEITPRLGASIAVQSATALTRPAVRARELSHRLMRSVDVLDHHSELAGAIGRQVRLRLPRPGDDDEEGEGVVQSDISQLMLHRAKAGYGFDPLRNERLAPVDSVLPDFWSWIAHADTMAQEGRAIVDGYDFGFQGVLPILRGFAPIGAPHTSPLQNSPAPRSRRSSISPSSLFDDIKLSLQRGDKPHQTQFAAAASGLLHRHRAFPFTAATTGTRSQRQLALMVCGPDFGSEDIEPVVRRYEKLGQFGKACAVAFFSGNTQRAIKSLQSSDDTRLKLLAPILATSLSMRSQGSARDKLFDEVCHKVATDGHADPLIRAMLAYVATGDWHEVLDEGALPLKDRVAVALRFLSDEELMEWIEGASSEFINSGDLEGVVLTGLSMNGMQLLQRHVNRTGDVQTAALAASLVVPGRLTHFQGERWIATYRVLLNRWKLFTHRAKFDVARGERMREARESIAAAGVEVGKDGKVLETLVPFAPPQLWIKCGNCNEAITAEAPAAGSAAGSGKRPGQTSDHHRTTQCPHCSKYLPKCSVCLTPLGVGDPRKIAWSWCHRCRHTGHTEHMRQWRDRGNEECPVAGCNCRCWSTERSM